MTTTKIMKVWHDGVDTYVANDLDDLAAVYREHTGEDYERAAGVPVGESFSAYDDDEQIAIYWNEDILNEPPEGAEVIEDDHGGNPDWTHRCTARAGAWAAWWGHGFLASTEW